MNPLRHPSFRLGPLWLAVGLLGSLQAQSPDSAGSASPADHLQQTLKEIRGQLPSQSHTMADVSYQFSNLWFAGQAQNWPLAGFLLGETKSHLHWAVRVRPVRPLSDGGKLDVGAMLSAIERSTLKELADSVQAKDQARFVAAYKQQLGSCYACHVAAEKPYLRLHVPERPADTLMEFDPAKPGSPQP